MALRHVASACGLLVGALWCERAAADLLVSIDKSTQSMTVSVDGKQRYVWPVSTGRKGFGTPNGSFRAQWMARRYFSRKYYNSPMPHAIFFHEGYAIHGTEYIRRLGGTASHGCVRLHPANAKLLYELVLEHKRANTRIEVTGANPTAIAKKSAKTSKLAAAREGRAERRARKREARERYERPREASSSRRTRYRYYYPTPRYGSDSAYARWYYYGARPYY